MSQWHRENPELAFIGADPWMDHESHRQAYEELRHMGLVHDDEATETNQEASRQNVSSSLDTDADSV